MAKGVLYDNTFLVHLLRERGIIPSLLGQIFFPNPECASPSYAGENTLSWRTSIRSGVYSTFVDYKNEKRILKQKRKSTSNGQNGKANYNAITSASAVRSTMSSPLVDRSPSSDSVPSKKRTVIRLTVVSTWNQEPLNSGTSIPGQ